MFGKRINEISVQELKKRMDKGDNMVLVDIRKPREWVQTGVIPGSELITDEAVIRGIDSGLLSPKIENQTIIFICKSGNRSSKITSFLSNHRQTTAKFVNMKGGILAWKRMGYDVVAPVS